MRVACLCLAATLAAQDLPRVEFNVAAWRQSIEGTIQSGIVPVDLRADLALADTWRLAGSAHVRFGGRHGIVVEGSPMRFTGRNRLARTIQYNNRTYFVQDTLSSEAELAYVFGGYQWDFLARPHGHIGLRAGAAYLDASGTLVSETTGISASRGYRLGLPLAGVQGRASRGRFEIEGAVQGMALGRYGHFVQGSLGAGARIVGGLGARVGVILLDADIHERGEGAPGVAPRIAGPAVTIFFRR
jgi:hypothetical protein